MKQILMKTSLTCLLTVHRILQELPMFLMLPCIFMRGTDRL